MLFPASNVAHIVITTLSGQSGATLRSFDASTGHVISERRLHPPTEGVTSQPPQFGNYVAYAADRPTDLLVLTNGYIVSHIDGSTGETKWTWAAPDQTYVPLPVDATVPICNSTSLFFSSLVIYTKLISTSYAIYVIGVSKSTASYTLHVTALLSSTGQVLNEVDVPSKIANPITDVVLLSLRVPHQYRPRVVWLEDGQIKSKALTPDLKNPPGDVKNLVFDKILDVGLSGYGYFVALKQGEPARIMKMEEDGTVIRSWGEFDKVHLIRVSIVPFS